MKIDDLNQKPTAAYLTSARVDKADTADSPGETAAKQQASGDKVELSSYMPKVPSSQTPEGLRLSRVQEIKSQIQDGSYQVSSTAVAEKMLTKLSFK